MLGDGSKDVCFVFSYKMLDPQVQIPREHYVVGSFNFSKVSEKGVGRSS